MKVLKFGGTSVGSAENIARVVEILLDYKAKGEQFTVVFSAVGGMTNKLIEMSNLAEKNDKRYLSLLKEFEETHYSIVRDLIPVQNQSPIFAVIKTKINDLQDVLHGVSLINELSKRTLDFILSHGERLSAYIIAELAKHEGMEAEFVDARKFMRTNSEFGNAKVDFEITDKQINDRYVGRKAIQFVTGFIGSDAKGVTTTLGRGGSDYTAAILAAALNAKEVEIWTDVDGVMTADPRRVKNAFTLPAISYNEAMELSHFGAKVIYPPTLQPVFAKRIPIRIKNTFNPEFGGTYISERSGVPHKHRVKGISSINEIALISIQGSGMIGVAGFSARLFGCLANNEINLIMITQASSEHSICFAVAPEDAEKARKVIEREFLYEIQALKIDPVKVEGGKSVVAIVGENMKDTPGISGKMFNALGVNGVNVSAIAQGSSELNVSAVIDHQDISKALNALHDAFFLSDTSALNVFMVGPGLIGATLLKQIKEQAEHLYKTKQLDIRVVSIANSKRMIFDEAGLDLDNWQDALEKGEPSSLDDFVDKMAAMNLPNSVFVDNTSNKAITTYYAKILEKSISIVTPNKVANSSSYEDYKRLKDIAFRRGVKFFYETNVGAGLPVINTLEALMHSGDDILKIEGVLSGSLSYIFNTYDGSTTFKDVVLQAKEAGYTEPDPREDLNGMDVARKILILSREAGYEMQPQDVHVENILPQACIDAPTVEKFFEELEKADDSFKSLIAEAQGSGKKLRFIATLDQGKATVGLRAVDGSHPFFSMAGSDNMISYTTSRYLNNPLVIKGPGAGAEVTAAGVFADIISIGSYLS